MSPTLLFSKKILKVLFVFLKKFFQLWWCTCESWIYTRSCECTREMVQRLFFLKEKCFLFFWQGSSTRVTLLVDDSSALWTLHWTHSFSLYWFLYQSLCSYVDWRDRNEKGVIVSKKKFFCTRRNLDLLYKGKRQITTSVRIVKFGTNNLLERLKSMNRVVERTW